MIVVNDSLQSNSLKSLDNKYLKNGTTPYASIAEANATIVSQYRSQGLTVLIGAQEYWYLGGVLDTNLILKSTTNSITWGNITGTLSNQVDLQNALNQKEPDILPGTVIQYWRGDKTWQTLTSDVVTEGSSNLYLTPSRVRSQISGGAGITYNSSTGVITSTIPAQIQSDYTQANNLALDFIKNKPTIPAQFNPIAGANVTLTGTYPSITFNSTNGAGSGSIKFMWIVGGANNFAGIPGSPTPPVAGATTLVNSLIANNDVRVSFNGQWLIGVDPGDGTLHYTKTSLSSNTVTFSAPIANGDQLIVETLIPGIGSSSAVTSVGLTMPAAFAVANSPITSAGTIGVTATGTTGQYIRGDGTLATFPATGGSVTSVGLTVPTGLIVTGSPITTTGTLAITTTLNGVVHANGSGFTAGNVNLATEVTGNLTVSHLNSGTNASGATYFRGDGTWQTPPVTTPAGTTGSIQINNAGAFAADGALFWDFTNKRLGVGTGSPAVPLHVISTGSGIGITIAATSSVGSASVSLVNDVTTGFVSLAGSGTSGVVPANFVGVTAPGTGGISLVVGSTEALRILTNTQIRLFNLTGSGTRMVVSDSTGVLSAQAIPSSGVTSVAMTVPSAFTVSGSPITTTGTLAITANGTTGQYIRGDGTLATLPSGTGSVTSVAATITGNAIGLTGSPITTTGTLAFSFAGTSSQYINGAGNLIAFPTIPAQVNLTAGANISISGAYPNLAISAAGSVSSVALTMPAAFAITGSPITSSGTLAVTAIGNTGQYIRGDGTLSVLPTQVNSDWNATSGVAQILNKPTIGAGTVTSVALTVPAGMSVSGSPITGSGTLAITTALTGPVRGTGTGFTVGLTSLSTEVTGVLSVINGGTGNTGFATNAILVGGSVTTGALQQMASGTAGQVVMSAGAGAAPFWSNIVTTITGTVNQVNVSAGTGTVVLSTPQDIATGSNVTFAGVSAISSLNGPLFSVADPTNGGIELGSSTSTVAVPYINFHLGKGAAEAFNVQLKNISDGILALSGSLTTTGTITTNLLAIKNPTQANIFFLKADGSNGFQIGRSLGSTNNNDLFIWDNVASTARLQIDSSGKVIIPGTVQSTSFLVKNSTASLVAFLKADGTPGYRIGRSRDGDNLQNFFIFDDVAANFVLNIDSSGKVIIPNVVQILGGSPGVNKILTSDASGNASWGTTIATGTYIPTLTNTTNITTSTPNSTSYTRVGNNVHVVVTGTLQPTSNNANGVLTISLPITTSNSAQPYCGHGALAPNAGGQLYLSGLVSVLSTTVATFNFYFVGSTTTANFSCSFDYTL